MKKRFITMALALALVVSGSVVLHAQAQTAPAVISNVSATLNPSDPTMAMINWTTSTNADSQVNYGTTTNYNLNSGLYTDMITNHQVNLWSLMPNTTYHFQVVSRDAYGNFSTSTDQVIMTASSTQSTTASTTNGTSTGTTMGTTTATTTTSTTTTGTTTTNTTTGTTTSPYDLQSLINYANQLQQQLNWLQQQIQLLGGGTTVGSTTTSTGGTGMIEPSQVTVGHGASIDFTGRQFGREESVMVTVNGAIVARAHADGGGNFSTGSLPVPMTLGTLTYTFTGQNSGIIGTAMVTVQ